MVVIIEEPPPTLHGAGSLVSQQQLSSSVRQAEHDAEEARRAKLMKKRLKRLRYRERKKQLKTMDPKFWSKNMDPEIWGNLPPNLTLEIYKKLPIRYFYQLREVCKDWNLLARERRCVTDPIHKPYFVLIHEGDDDIEYDDYLHGILTFHIKSGRWRWKKLHPISFKRKLLHKPFSVKGLTFSRYSNDTYRVFDAHTRTKYIISQQPETSKKSRALGMTVDTSAVPHTFKIIVGSLDTGTQIYDSVTKLWETKSSFLVPCEEPNFKTCLHCGGHMYIWSELDKILVYSLKDDIWSTLKPPSRLEDDLNWRGLGSWQGRIFTVTCDECGGSFDEDEDENFFAMTAPLLWVWELVDQSEETVWEFSDQMPADMQKWLIPPRLHEYEDIRVSASFCDEHVLIYSWVAESGRAYRFVLYNLETKKWEKVESPNRSVSINPDDEKDTKEWDFGDPCSMRFSDFMATSMMAQRELFARGLLEHLMGGTSDDTDYDYDDDAYDSAESSDFFGFR